MADGGSHMSTSGEQLETLNKAGSGAHLVAGPDCTEEFNQLKLKRKYRYLTFSVGTETIDVDKRGERDSSYDSFKSALPYTDCRFVVYDHEKMDPVRKVPVNRIFFLTWNPVNSSTHNKMAYTAAKQKLVSALGSALTETNIRSLEELDSALGVEAEEDDGDDDDWMDD